MNWRDRARAAISAASGQIDPGLTLAYQAGVADERAAWQEATGADNADEYVEPQRQSKRKMLKLQFPGQ